MFKLIQLLAAFVVRQYEKEAKRLHAATAKADRRYTDLSLELEELAAKSERELAEFLKQQAERHEQHLSEVEQARQDLEAHSATANAASEKARTVKGALV